MLQSIDILFHNGYSQISPCLNAEYEGQVKTCQKQMFCTSVRTLIAFLAFLAFPTSNACTSVVVMPGSSNREGGIHVTKTLLIELGVVHTKIVWMISLIDKAASRYQREPNSLWRYSITKMTTTNVITH